MSPSHQGRARRLSASEVDPFVRGVLLAPTRTLPVVAVTLHFGLGQFLVAPDDLAAAHRDSGAEGASAPAPCCVWGCGSYLVARPDA